MKLLRLYKIIIALFIGLTNKADGEIRRLGRLAGGVPARLGEFPFLAASLHPEVRCTASILNKNWLLGAAHCYIYDSRQVQAKDVRLVAGVLDFTDKFCPSRQVRTARQIVIHPRFEEIKLTSSDLALVRVDDFIFNNYVDCIPLSGDPFVLETDTECTAGGWGDNFVNSSNSILRKLAVTAVQSKKACHGLRPSERKNIICLKEDEGRGLCDGDSGGPLICGGKIVGVAHQVYKERSKYKSPADMDCGAVGIVHTYIFTCPFLDWFHKYIPEAPSKPKHCFVPKMNGTETLERRKKTIIV